MEAAKVGVKGYVSKNKKWIVIIIAMPLLLYMFTVTGQSPIDLRLFLNNTEGNYYYPNSSVANISVQTNTSDLVNITSDIPGWTNASQVPPYSIFYQITCPVNNTWYSFTAIPSTGGDSVTYYAICNEETTTTTTTTTIESTTTTILNETTTTTVPTTTTTTIPPNWVINDDTVYIDDNRVYASATPHTIYSSGWVYFNLTSKVYTGDIDIVWGFDTSTAKPTQAELYHPHTVAWNDTHSQVFYNVSKNTSTSASCQVGFSYDTYKRNVTYTEPIYGSGGPYNITGWTAASKIVCFDSYNVFDGNDMIATWHEEKSREEDWLDKTSAFSSLDYDHGGMNKWYYVTGIPVTANTSYLARGYVDVPVQLEITGSKYWFCFKRSVDTIQEAIAGDRFYCLDPWWNSSWGYNKPITITSTKSLTDYQMNINVSYDSHMQTNFNDIRFTTQNGTTSLSYWIESKIDSSWASVWVKVPTLSVGSNTIYLYYGNPSVSSASNGNTTFILFDDFNGGYDTSKWTTGGPGTVGTSNGKLWINNTGTSVTAVYSANLPNMNNSYTKVNLLWSDESVYNEIYPLAIMDNTVYSSAVDMQAIQTNPEPPSGANTLMAEFSVNNNWELATVVGPRISFNTWHPMALWQNGTSAGWVNESGTYYVWNNKATIDQHAQLGFILTGYYSGANYNYRIAYDYIYTRQYSTPEPTYSIVSSERTQTWWDTAYGYRYLINSKAKTAGMPISINDTYGVKGNIIWTSNATSGEDIYLYSTAANYNGTLTVANKTTQKCYETNETGGHVQGNCPTSVWNNTRLVLHFENITTALDSSPFAGTSTILSGTPTIANGIYGKAWDMTGVDLQIPTNVLPKTTNPFTICFWINHTGTSLKYEYIFGHPDGSDVYTRFRYGDRLESIPGGCSQMDVYIPTNKWIYECHRYNTTTWAIFINGTQGNAEVCNPGTGGDPTSHEIYGGDPIDEFIVYNYSLSDKQIQDQYNMGLNALTSLGMEEKQWLDTSYPYRRQIISNSTSFYPLAVNDTGGIRGNVIWALIDNASYIYSKYYKSGDGVKVGDKLAENYWENATRQGNNPTSVWGLNAIAIYHFDNATGTTVYDSGPGGNNADFFGTPVWNTTVTKFGNALSMSANNHLTSTDADITGLGVNSNRATISVWIRPEAFPQILAYLFSTQTSSGGNGMIFDYYVTGTIMRWYITFHNGGIYEQTCVYTFTPGNWYYVVGTWNGTWIQIYINGTRCGTGSAGGDYISYGGGGYAAIGAQDGSDRRWDFIGVMDELQLWNVSLSDDQIQSMYYNGINNMTSLGSDEFYNWANTNYNYRWQIKSSAASDMPTALNDTNGVGGKMIYSSVSSNPYHLYSTSSSSFSNVKVINSLDNTEKCFETNESGGVAQGNCPYSVWNQYSPVLNRTNVVYHFENVTSLTDSSGHNNTAAVSVQTYVKGLFGGGLYFNNNDLETIPLHIVSRNDFTICMFANVTGSGTTSYLWMISNDVPGWVRIHSNNHIDVSLYSYSSGCSNINDVAWNFLNKWTLYCLRFNTTNDALFVNGTNVGEGTCDAIPTAFPGDPNAIGTGTMTVDDFMIFNYSLSDQQIYNMNQNGLSASLAPLGEMETYGAGGKTASVCTLTSSSGWSYAYPTATILTCGCTGDGVTHLYFNGVLHDDYNSSNIIYGVNAGYPVVCNSTEGVTYSSGTASNTLIVTAGSRTCTLATDKSWTRTYDTTDSSTTCSVSAGSSDGSMTFTMNATPVSTPDLRSIASVYNYACQWTGGVNYSDCSQQTNTLTINKATSTVSLIITPSTPITYGTQSNATCTDTNPEASFTLYKNGTDVTSAENNVLITLPAGVWNYTCAVPATQNYTSASTTQMYTVSKASRTCTLATDKSWTRTYDTTVSSTTCSVSAGSLDGSMAFTMNSTPVSTPDLRSPASIYNYACQWTEGFNYSDCTLQTNTLTINKFNASVQVFPPPPSNNASSVVMVDSSSSKNVTFTGNQSQTVYLSIPKNVTVLSAQLNLSGYSVYANMSQIIDTIGGMGTSVAVDTNGISHVSSTLGGGGPYTNILRYCNNTGGTWSCISVPGATNVMQYDSIALDSNNKVHIAYKTTTPSPSLSYCTNAGGSWSCSSIDAGNNYGRYPSIAIDKNDKVHISFVNGSPTSGTPRYCTNAGGSWVCGTITGHSPSLGGYSDTSLVVDSNNYPHVLLTTASEGGGETREIYCNKTTGSWTCVNVTSSMSLNIEGKMVKDKNGIMHIIYTQSGGCGPGGISSLRYCNNTNGWNCIDTCHSDTYWTISLAVDGNIGIHVFGQQPGSMAWAYCNSTDYVNWYCGTIGVLSSNGGAVTRPQPGIAIQQGRLVDSTQFLPNPVFVYSNETVLDTFNTIYTWYNSNYTTNPYLDVGNNGDIQWSFYGFFSQLNNRTADFSSEINQYLLTCTPVSGNCSVPLVLHSDTYGIIQISAVNVNYQTNVYYPTWVIQYCTDLSPWLDCLLYRNEVLIPNGTAEYLPPGNYTYYANISDIYNYTDWQTPYHTLNISKGPAIIMIEATPSSPITYETQSNVTCSGPNLETTPVLYRNGSIVALSEIAYLPAGVWNYTCTVGETGNYTAASTTLMYTVDKKDAAVNVYPVTQSQTYPYSATQYCIDSSNFFICSIYRDESSITNGTDYLPAAGTYVYKANISDSFNYTNYQDTEIFTLNKNNTNNLHWISRINNVNIGAGNFSLTYSNIPNVTSYFNAYLTESVNLVLYRNGTQVASPVTYVESPDQCGTYGYECAINDTRIDIGVWNFTAYKPETQNYTSFTSNIWVTVNIGNASVRLSPSSQTGVYPYTVTQYCADSSAILDCKLYRNDVDITSQNNTDIILPVGNYIYVANISDNHNYTNWQSSSSVNVTINTTAISIYWVPDSPITYNDSITTVLCNETNLEASYTLYRNGTAVSITTNTVNTLNDSSSSKNLTFSGDQNMTTWINLPKYSNVLNAQLNVSGYSATPTSYIDSNYEESGGYYGTGFDSNPSHIGTMVWFNSSTGLVSGNLSGVQIRGYAMNSTGIDGFNATIWVCEVSGMENKTCLDNDFRFYYHQTDCDEYSNPYYGPTWLECNETFAADYMNYTLDSSKTYRFKFVQLDTTPSGAYRYFYDTIIDFTPTITKDTIQRCNFGSDGSGAGSGCASVVYENMSFKIMVNSTYPTNPYIDVSGDGDIEWYYSGGFSRLNTVPFTSEINSYLSTCIADAAGYCNVPLVLHSDTAGILQVSAVNVYYEIGSTLPAGVWNYTCYVPATQNYTSAVTARWYTVNKYNSNVQVYPITQVVTYPTWLLQYCTDISPWLDCHIYRNGALIGNNTNELLPVGNYTYVANITDYYNYTNWQASSSVNITTNNTQMTLTVTPASPIIYETLSNATCTETNPEAAFTLYRNGTNVTGSNLWYEDDTDDGHTCSYGCTGADNFFDDNWNTMTQHNDLVTYYINYTLLDYTKIGSIIWKTKVQDISAPSGDIWFWCMNQVSGNWIYAGDVPYPSSADNFTWSLDSSCFSNNNKLQLKVNDSNSMWQKYYEEMISVYTNSLGINTESTYLPAGVWNYTCVVPQTQNYTGASATVIYTVNKKNANVQVYPTTQSMDYESTPLLQYCTDDAIFYTCSNYRNSSLITNGTNPRLGAGVYLYNANTTDILDYTNYQSSTQTLTITKHALDGHLYLDGLLDQNVLYTYHATTNATAYGYNIDGLLPSLYRDGVYKGQTEIVMLSPGNYTYKANITGNANYTSDGTGKSYNATVVWPPFLLMQSPISGTYILSQPANKSISLNYTVSDLYPVKCWYNIDTYPNNITLTNCLNTTLNMSAGHQYLFTLYANESYNGTENSTSASFWVDFLNQWTVNDAIGHQLLNGTALFNNGTYNYTLSTTNGIFFENTSEMPQGNLSITFAFSNMVPYIANYTVDNSTQINDTISMTFGGISVRVFGEDSLSAIPWWKLQMTNSTISAAGAGGYTTQITAGKGLGPGLPLLDFLDDSSATYVENSDYNYTYEFGYTRATFVVMYSITGAAGSNNNITIRAWNNTAGKWNSMFNLTSGNAATTSSYFYIDNTGPGAAYGDLFSTCLGSYYCPLFELKMQPDASAKIRVYDVRLVSPYTYDINGFVTANFSSLVLVTGESRFVFTSIMLPSTNNYGLRTYFLNPTSTGVLSLDAYLNNLCYVQAFQVISSSNLASGQPISIADAKLTLYRNFGGTKIIVDQQKSDYSGIARLCVEAGFPYDMITTATGYQSNNAYDEVFSNTGLYYIRMASSASSDYINMYNAGGSFYPPAGTYIYHNSSHWINCSWEWPVNATPLYAWFTVNRTIITDEYPPYIFNNYNITNASNLTYPPVWNNQSMPWRLNMSGYQYLYYNATQNYVPGMASFNFSLDVTDLGQYDIECGEYYNISDNNYWSGDCFGKFQPFFNCTSTVSKVREWSFVFAGTNETGVKAAGGNLKTYIEGNGIWIAAFFLDMLITAFVVRQFGTRSSFIWLLIWAVMLTVLGGWGFTAYTGVFALGAVLWLALLFGPFR